MPQQLRQLRLDQEAYEYLLTYRKMKNPGQKTVADFLNGKLPHTIELMNHFVKEFQAIGEVTLHPASTMIGIATPRKRIAWITQLGKNFVHVVFPFEKAYEDNLCFQKIAQVPGDAKQFNHHFRMYDKQDVNEEVKKFMQLAYDEGS
jgi:hypothetical protein